MPKAPTKPHQTDANSRALDILTNTFSKQLSGELAHGYNEMVKQAEELVFAAKGNESDVSATLSEALKAVEGWNNRIITEETARIVRNKRMLPTLNTAAMVAGTQVLFSIRPFEAEDQAAKFDLKAPELTSVVHQAYINVADNVLDMLDKDPMNYKVKERELYKLCEIAAREAHETMLPFDDIFEFIFGRDLDAYLKKASENLNVSGEEEEEPATETAESEEPADESVMAAAPIPSANDPLSTPVGEDSAMEQGNVPGEEREGPEDEETASETENENEPPQNNDDASSQASEMQDTRKVDFGAPPALSQQPSYTESASSGSGSGVSSITNPNAIPNRYIAESRGKQFLSRIQR